MKPFGDLQLSQLVERCGRYSFSCEPLSGSGQTFQWMLGVGFDSLSLTNHTGRDIRQVRIVLDKDVSRQKWLYPRFWRGRMGSSDNEELDAYSVVLGSVIRDIRLKAGLPGDAFSGVVTRANLHRIESGQVQVRFGTLIKLCEVLGVAPSHVVFAVEARVRRASAHAYLAESADLLASAVNRGQFDPLRPDEVLRGLKGRRSDQLHQAVNDSKLAGLSKEEAAKKLGVTTRTVERYWSKAGAGPHG